MLKQRTLCMQVMAPTGLASSLVSGAIDVSAALLYRLPLGAFPVKKARNKGLKRCP